MRGNRLAVLGLIALLVDDAKAFTPNNLVSAAPQSTLVQPDWTATTRLYASTFQTGTKDEVAFPYDDGKVRFAYDEWRVVFGKGPYNEERFQIFKENYKIITVSNLQGRKEAQAARQPPPEWRTLNEFGDISLAEFEAYRRGVPLPTTTLSVVTPPPVNGGSPGLPMTSVLPAVNGAAAPLPTTLVMPAVNGGAPLPTTSVVPAFSGGRPIYQQAPELVSSHTPGQSSLTNEVGSAKSPVV
jgi:hypothetical protein